LYHPVISNFESQISKYLAARSLAGHVVISNFESQISKYLAAWSPAFIQRFQISNLKYLKSQNIWRRGALPSSGDFKF